MRRQHCGIFYGNIVKTEKTVNGISMEVFRKMEEMQELTLDILNTILIDSRFDVCYPVSEEESEVLIKLKDHRKKKLANLKQKKRLQK